MKKWIMAGFILFPVAVVLGYELASGRTPEIKDDSGNPIPESIATLESVTLGEMQQWVLIRGNDISNPVLLWLHGGPGAAQMPVARHFNSELEQHFIVVHWDQRGSGKSNPHHFDEQTMTFDRFLNDAQQLTQLLKQRFNQEKIFLVGHSWGSHLGIMLVQAYPEDYHAYIGVSQLVDPLAGHSISLAWLEPRIDSAGNQQDMERLAQLRPPPFTDHSKYVIFAGLVGKYGGNMDVGMLELAWIALRAPEYRLGDYLAWINGSTRGSGPMWEQTLKYNMFRDVPLLELPVYFFSGRNDYNTPLELVEEYYKALDAPLGKQLIIFDESAHTPFMGEVEKFNQELVRVKEETYP
jgi:pimeloyl-ACP methyl ester carboxylesterase